MFRILSVTRSLTCSHALSYGNKGHLYDCACVRRGPSVRGYTAAIACVQRVHAHTLQHERQGRTLGLDYRPCAVASLRVTVYVATVST